ncbi:MAG: ATP-binding protein [Microcoleaceae cyanobacterium]
MIEICKIRTQEKAITFVSHLDPRLPKGVITDEKRLRQVLINLLGNAIKFTNQGFVTFTVEILASAPSVSTSRQDNSFNPGAHPVELFPQVSDAVKLRFQIEDTGVGMSPEQLKTIFLPFEQVGETTKKSEGTGLGLAISRKIVRLMQSDLYVESQLGRGSRFWLDLELKAVKHQQTQAQDEVPKKIIGVMGQAPRILIADDRPENRTVITELLTPLGFTCIEASDGQEGLQQISNTPVDLVITNIVMPVMNGLEMIQRIRQSPQLHHVPIVVSSGRVFQTEQQKCFAAGADAFLPKPVQIDQLFACLKEQLNLEWVYQDQQPTPRHSTVKPSNTEIRSERLESLPQAEIEHLLDLTRRGHVVGIEESLRQLEHLGNEQSLIATELRKLTQGFQLKQIRQILESHLRIIKR